MKQAPLSRHASEALHPSGTGRHFPFSALHNPRSVHHLDFWHSSSLSATHLPSRMVQAPLSSHSPDFLQSARTQAPASARHLPEDLQRSDLAQSSSEPTMHLSLAGATEHSPRSLQNFALRQPSSMAMVQKPLSSTPHNPTS